MDKFEFLPNDFEFVGEAHDITKDYIAPAKPAWKDALDRFAKNKGAVIGACVIILFAILAIIVPIVSQWEYDAMDTALSNIKPCLEHIFGTDKFGRDLFVRTWKGTRVSLFIAIVAVVIDVTVGLIYGLVSGYFGGKIDAVLQRFQEIMNSIPTLVILTLLLTVMKASLTTVIVALAFTEWIPMSRITRAQVLKVKEELEQLLKKIDEQVTFHDFRMVHGEKQINLIFDILVPFSYDREQQNYLKKTIAMEMKRLDPRYVCVITVDTSYLG